MSLLKHPVFVRFKGSGEVRRYNSAADRQSFFEPIDIENDEYEAWDAAATPLALSVKSKPNWLGIEPAGTPQPEQLTRALANFAWRAEVEIEPSKFSCRFLDRSGSDHVGR